MLVGALRLIQDSVSWVWLMLIPASECCLIAAHSLDIASTPETGISAKTLAPMRFSSLELISVAWLQVMSIVGNVLFVPSLGLKFEASRAVSVGQRQGNDASDTPFKQRLSHVSLCVASDATKSLTYTGHLSSPTM